MQPPLVVYPVLGDGNCFLPSISFLCLLQQDAKRNVTFAQLKDKTDKLRQQLLQQLNGHFHEHQHCFPGSTQLGCQQCLSSGTGSKADQKLVLFLAELVTELSFAVHTAQCQAACVSQAIATHHLVLSDGVYAAACPLHFDIQELYRPANQCVGKHAISCKDCIMRCFICRRMLTATDKRSKSHIYPEACLGMLDVMCMRAADGKVISSSDMSFRSLCFGKGSCEEMLNLCGEGEFAKFFRAIVTDYTMPVHWPSSSSWKIFRCSVSIMFRLIACTHLAAMEASATTVADQLLWLDKLRSYLLTPTPEQPAPNWLLLGLHMMTPNSVTMWTRKYGKPSVNNITHGPVSIRFQPSLLTPPISFLAFVGPLQMTLHVGDGASVLATHLPQGVIAIAQQGPIHLPDGANRVLCTELFQCLDMHMPELLLMQKRAASNSGEATAPSADAPLLQISGSRLFLPKDYKCQLQQISLPFHTVAATKRQGQTAVHLLKPKKRSTFDTKKFDVLVFCCHSSDPYIDEMLLTASTDSESQISVCWHDAVKDHAESWQQAIIDEDIVVFLIKQACLGESINAMHKIAELYMAKLVSTADHA